MIKTSGCILRAPDKDVFHQQKGVAPKKCYTFLFALETIHTGSLFVKVCNISAAFSVGVFAGDVNATPTSYQVLRNGCIVRF